MRKNKIQGMTVAAVSALFLAFSSGSVIAEEPQQETELQAAVDTVIHRPEYKASDYVTLGEYKGLLIEEPDMTVTDEKIDAEIQKQAGEANVLVSIENGTVQQGDVVNIDFKGTIDGSEFAGGSAESFDLVIGSGTFIDGFEKGLVGASVGTETNLALKFPGNYFNQDYAGKDVSFAVTVNSIRRVPELTEELIGKITEGAFHDLASYREDIKKKLESDSENNRRLEIERELLTMVANGSQIKAYPQEMLDYASANMEKYYQAYADAYQMSLEDFLSLHMGLTASEFKEQITVTAEQNLQQELYLLAIAEAEGITVTPEELASSTEEFAQLYGYDSPEAMRAVYGEDEIKISVLQNKALAFLVDNAVIGSGEAESESQAENE